MALFKVRAVDPLQHNVPIVDSEGRPTPQFMRQWIQARTINLTTGDLTIAVGDLRALIEAAQALITALEERQIITGDGLQGGGDLSADRTLEVDNSVVRTTREVNTGTGLTGGGDLSADREIALADTTVTPGSYGGVGQHISITVDQQGRVTAISDV